MHGRATITLARLLPEQPTQLVRRELASCLPARRLEQPDRLVGGERAEQLDLALGTVVHGAHQRRQCGGVDRARRAQIAST